MFEDIKTQKILSEILIKLGQINTKLAEMNKLLTKSEKSTKTQISKSSGISQ